MSLSGHRNKLCKVSVRADLLDSSKASKRTAKRCREGSFKIVVAAFVQVPRLTLGVCYAQHHHYRGRPEGQYVCYRDEVF